MAYTDKNLSCVECKAPFVFSARDQEFHASKGFANEPKRCPTCRQARKVQRGDAVPASGGAGRPSGPAVYAGPRAQSRPGGGSANFGRPRSRRNDFDRGGREGGHGEAVGARSFDGVNGEGPRSYTANCMACGRETAVSGDGNNRVIFCSECYDKMTAIASS